VSEIGQARAKRHWSAGAKCYGSTVFEETSSPSAAAIPNGTRAGILICVGAALTVFAVAHHPTVAGRPPAEAIVEIVRLAQMDRLVHGSLIVILGGLLYGFTVFSLRRGLHRETVVAALIAYAVGILSSIGAAVIDGFITPDVAAHYAGASQENIFVAARLLSYGGLAIQELTKLGMSAMSLAMLLWSASLMRTPGALRYTGILGSLAALIPIGVLITQSHITPSSLGIIVLAQGIWYVAIAALLIRKLV
jgi:hypothetical protein